MANCKKQGYDYHESTGRKEEGGSFIEGHVFRLLGTGNAPFLEFCLWLHRYCFKLLFFVTV